LETCRKTQFKEKLDALTLEENKTKNTSVTQFKNQEIVEKKTFL
jgi:hypothetical protein